MSNTKKNILNILLISYFTFVVGCKLTTIKTPFKRLFKVAKEDRLRKRLVLKCAEECWEYKHLDFNVVCSLLNNN